MSSWDRFLETFFNAKVMAKYLPDIAHGMLVTVELAALVIVAGLVAGLALALLRSLGFRPVNLLLVFIVDLFRALPPLVIIVFIYFGLPAVDVSPSGFVSTGLSYGQTLINVVLPQALRLTIPPLTNRTIAITKGTALGTVVAVSEILGMASSAVSNSYNPSPLTLGAGAYLILFLPMVIFGRWLETRMAWKR